MHIKHHFFSDIGLFTCKICKAYKSATMVKLLTHMRVHSETREYECSECGKCFKQASQLRNHRVMHLDRKTLEVTRWYTSKKCDICGKTYANSKCLKNHIQAVHSKLRPYVCSVCGHASARKAMLQMHFRQHTGDKPFNCEICDYKTGDHNTLRRHIMQHTGKYHIKYIVRVVRVVRELQTIFLLQDFDRINVNIVHILRYRVVAIKIT